MIVSRIPIPRGGKLHFWDPVLPPILQDFMKFHLIVSVKFSVEYPDRTPLQESRDYNSSVDNNFFYH